MEYVPLHLSTFDSPKVMNLPAETYRFWTFALMSAQRNDYIDGELPDIEHLAHWTRTPKDDCRRLMKELTDAGLADETEDGWRIHNWNKWRNLKDPTSTQRKRKSRAAQKQTPQAGNVTGNVTGHGHVTDRSRPCHDESQAVTVTGHGDVPTNPNPNHNTSSLPCGSEELNSLSLSPEKERDRVRICHNGKFVDKAPSACTPEEIARLEATAIDAFSHLGHGDVWVRRIRDYAKTWRADWIELVIPIIVSKLDKSPTTGDSYGRTILQNWTTEGGPGASLIPAAPKLAGESSRSPPARPMTEHQKNMAAMRKRSAELAVIIAQQEADEAAQAERGAARADFA